MRTTLGALFPGLTSAGQAGFAFAGSALITPWNWGSGAGSTCEASGALFVCVQPTVKSAHPATATAAQRANRFIIQCSHEGLSWISRPHVKTRGDVSQCAEIERKIYLEGQQQRLTSFALATFLCSAKGCICNPRFLSCN